MKTHWMLGCLVGSLCGAAPALAHDACPDDPDVTVDSADALRAALAEAQPGQTIAVEGSITVAEPVWILTDDVRLTCATPGAAIRPAEDFTGWVPLGLFGRSQVVDHLVLEGVPGEQWPIGGIAPESRVAHNEILCGSVCGFMAESNDFELVDNDFYLGSNTFGGWFQNTACHDTLIAGNRFHSPEEPGPWLGFAGAIRVTDSDRVQITDNHVAGPLRVCINNRAMAETTIAHNTCEATGIGIRSLSDRDGTIHSNVLLGVDGPGIVLGEAITFQGDALGPACANAVFGNAVPTTADGVTLQEGSGDNLIAQSPRFVTDAGSADCTGDGSPDPNVVTGQ